MNHLIRPYRNEDFAEIAGWVCVHNQLDIPNGLLVEDGSFVLELNKIPALCLTVLKTQSKEISYLFGYVKNPEFKNISLEKQGHALWSHCFNYAKDAGYKRIMCFANIDKLKSKYERYGMTRTLDNASTFAKEL